jgi:hypothetical protein
MCVRFVLGARQRCVSGLHGAGAATCSRVTLQRRRQAMERAQALVASAQEVGPHPGGGGSLRAGLCDLNWPLDLF